MITPRTRLLSELGILTQMPPRSKTAGGEYQDQKSFSIRSTPLARITSTRGGGFHSDTRPANQIAQVTRLIRPYSTRLRYDAAFPRDCSNQSTPGAWRPRRTCLRGEEAPERQNSRATAAENPSRTLPQRAMVKANAVAAKSGVAPKPVAATGNPTWR